MNIGSIGNPIKAIPRYAKVISEGWQKLPNSYPGGNINSNLYKAANFVTDHRLESIGAGLAGMAANHALGNPIGGLVDFATFGMTDFKPDRDKGAEPVQSIILQQPGMQTPSQVGVPTMPVSIPQLNEEDRKRQQQYLQRKIATDLLTVQALSQQPGMDGYV